MKIRSGFVSNSSSASFIIKFKSQLPEEEISNYIRKSDKWLDERWDATQRRVFDFDAMRQNGATKDKMHKYEPCTPYKDEFFYKEEDGWNITPYTTMMNDWMDVPAWQFIRAISEGRIEGIKLEHIIQTESEYESTNSFVEFDVHTWEYGDLDREDESNKISIYEKEDDTSYNYIKYLSSVGVKITDEESVFLAKNHLSKF